MSHPGGPCKWTFEDEHELWWPECRVSYVTNSEILTLQGISFCPWCGRKIEPVVGEKGGGNGD